MRTRHIRARVRVVRADARLTLRFAAPREPARPGEVYFTRRAAQCAEFIAGQINLTRDVN